MLYFMFIFLQLLTEVGQGLTGFGLIFTFAGVLLTFDKGFLAIGNILFLSGMILTIGMKSSLHFFMKPQNYKAAVSFCVGFFFVITGWPIIGMIVETYGFVVLFSTLSVSEADEFLSNIQLKS
ncbi:UNVERIFIED_CONTAM: Vesicle transport protein GOT1 [Sesamum latifolium]|uniref:Vesicle transport protein GOT1 n=1 Tax=Sesamum latifolium TaxID=2727402 RepID=A0AAW2YEQ8_9LAMI